MKRLNGIALICVGSNRARIYLQRMIQNRFIPCQVFFLERKGEKLSEEKARRQGNRLSDTELKAIQADFGVDLCLDIPAFCQAHQIPLIRLETMDINSDTVYQALSEFEGDTLIFAAKGILKRRILSLGKRFLHVHPGYLPDYKGSTTVYYSLLDENRCAASAFFMSTGIDTGQLLKRRYFDAPKDRQLLDHFYDAYIRSEVLLDVLMDYIQKGFFTTTEQPEGGETYHIIHPVLKHLAILGYRS